MTTLEISAEGQAARNIASRTIAELAQVVAGGKMILKSLGADAPTVSTKDFVARGTKEGDKWARRYKVAIVDAVAAKVNTVGRPPMLGIYYGRGGTKKTPCILKAVNSQCTTVSVESIDDGSVRDVAFRKELVSKTGVKTGIVMAVSLDVPLSAGGSFY